ncbi:MAG TPA: UDP-N-acetylmuramate dehydrogenase [Puia sp.]|nr:UDP-N-acetylmuramate dehydrogenase [Puia sp.]
MGWTANFDLQPYNTFGIAATARHFARFSGIEELAELLESGPRGRDLRRNGDAAAAGRRGGEPLFVLGGGSNVLLTKDIDGWVLKNEIAGIRLVREDERHCYVQVGAGEAWHPFVLYCLDRNWAGVENLSLIPGNVGASPMQNIGAYGVELRDVFHELEAWDLQDGKIRMFTLNDCQFGYRDSVFRHSCKDRFIILNVTFRLNRKPIFHTGYGAIREELEKMEVQQLSIRAVSEAVIRIRTAKLPDPVRIGNAGSFFKNPAVPNPQFAALKDRFPDIVGYPDPHHPVTKLAAGWMIEQCGWKGFRRGDAGCHERQALVLVNYGHASGREIFELSEEILRSVRKKFGVTLEREVNIV